MAATSADDVVLRESERFEAVRSTIEELQVVAMNVDDVIVRGSLHSLLSHLEAYVTESQEWTIPRAAFDLRLAVVGNPTSGKSQVIHRFLTSSLDTYDPNKIGKYDQFKTNITVEGKPRLLLIRDVTGTPATQIVRWADAFLLVFNVCDESSFHMALTYYDKIGQERKMNHDLPVILVGTQDALTDAKRRVASADVKRVTAEANPPLHFIYMEANAKHGVNIDHVFREICRKMVLIRNAVLFSRSATLSPIKLGSPSPVHRRADSGEFMTSPQMSRKAKRKSALFSSTSGSKLPSQSHSGNAGGPGSVVGKGRSVPIKQGELYKKSKGALSKTEWKKKFVTLLKGHLIYYANIQDYMHDTHGKSITIQHCTVKIPGQRPIGSKATPTKGERVHHPTDEVDHTRHHHHHHHQSSSASSLHRPTQQELAVAVAAIALQKSLSSTEEGVAWPFDVSDDATSTTTTRPSSGELSPPPQWTPAYASPPEDWDGFRKRSGSNEKGSTNLSRSGTSVTPSSAPRKGHRRRRSWGAAKSLEEDVPYEFNEFEIVSLDGKTWAFEASSAEEQQSWVKAIQQQIMESLQGATSNKTELNPEVTETTRQAVKAIRERDGNDFCADCNSPNPEWVSLNLGALVCIECSGIHRKLGTHLSRIRSLNLDEWSPELTDVILHLGNNLSKRIYEATAMSRGYQRPLYSSSREDREKWIRAKYETKEFLKPFPNSGLSLSQHLIDAINVHNIGLVYHFLAHSIPDDVNEHYGASDFRTPLHFACLSGNAVILQLLIWYGADVNAEDGDGYTPLAYARSLNRQVCVDLLLQQYGANDGANSRQPLIMTDGGVILDELEASDI
ncbi:arf-GAP with GTPase, ANK repeat and PH domain-containing protein 1-like isoform X2 [Oscarella lobularis]|uniref:arf-GAP with GTPase, ANK repeat and PH domain-containing protein 1-like isoform X2 n=1 Tax=Oscarella lobularis TaxID=121494 RepID=UPI0033141257